MGTLYMGTVLAETVAIRNGPGLNFTVVENTVYHKGNTFYISKIETDGPRVWGYDGGGWACLTHGPARYVDYKPYVKPSKMAKMKEAPITPTNNASYLVPPNDGIMLLSEDVAGADAGIMPLNEDVAGADAGGLSKGSGNKTRKIAKTYTKRNTLKQNASGATGAAIAAASATGGIIGGATPPPTQESSSPGLTAAQQEEIVANNINGIFGQLMGSSANNGQLLRKSMRLFGLPYQFRKEIDVRVENVSTTVGRKFIENIIREAPVVTIIPGVPDYLPNKKNKVGWSHAFVQAATGSFQELQQLINDSNSEVRYYDFRQTYTDYIKYVNIMCRTAATFLELTETLDGKPLQSYDWRNYRWTGSNYKSVAGKMLSTAISYSSQVADGIVNKVAEFGGAVVDALDKSLGGSGNNGFKFKYTTSDTTEEEDAMVDSILQSSNFVQFYCDPDMGASESGTNSTSESKIKGMFDSGSDMLKELAFITNSGGMDISGAQDFVGSSANALADKLQSGGGMTEFFKRFIDVTGNVMKGENVIMPEIYNSSNYDKQYSITIHLKAPYGNRFAYYMDVLVPLFHLLALALPKQTSANTYGAPFLVKAYCEGVFSCNLGIVSSISINKNVSPESWTNDGFPSEVDVTLTITDLYSDLTMSPQSEPRLFLANSSLIEYLATTCGLNLIQPQIGMRLKNTIQTIKNSFADIKTNVLSEAANAIENLISPWVSIS